MNVLTILEVGIGIMFVWFLVSMLVSSIQELIASLLQWRARDLEEEIRQMLEHPERISWPTQVGTTLKGTVGRVRTFFGGPAPLPQAPSQLAPVGAGAGGPVPAQHLEMNVAAGTLPAPNAAASSAGGKTGSFAKGEVSQGSFYRHPLIRDLSLNTGKPKPSYIPTTRFADVLFDLIVDAGAPNSAVLQAAQQAGDLLKDLDAANVQALDADAQRIFLQFRGAVQEVSAWTRNDQRDEGLIQKINVLAGECVKKNENLGFAVRLLQSALQNPPLRQQLASGVVELTKRGDDSLGRTLNTLVMRAMENAKDADSAIAAARQNVEAWFDASMERLTGNYKRHVHYFALVAGLLAALLLNIDSLAIVRTLWFDPTIRAAVVSNAQTIAAQPQPAGQGGDTTAVPSGATDKAFQEVVTDMQALQLPLGWTTTSDAKLCGHFFGWLYKAGNCIYPAGMVSNPLYGTATNVPINTADQQSKLPTLWGSLLGIFITGLAVMPGAPFWFDWLSKLVSLRAAGTVSTPSKEKTEKKADKKE